MNAKKSINNYMKLLETAIVKCSFVFKPLRIKLSQNFFLDDILNHVVYQTFVQKVHTFSPITNRRNIKDKKLVQEASRRYFQEHFCHSLIKVDNRFSREH